MITDENFTELHLDQTVAQIDIYTDGAVRNYGKPNQTSGYGINIEGHSEISIIGDNMNITMMEMKAVKHSLRIVEFLYKDGYRGHVTIRTDSKFVMDAITKLSIKWQRRHWINHQGNKIIYKEIIMECFEILSRISQLTDLESIKWEHVKAHSGDVGNELADQLARLACDRSEVGCEIKS
ncbi:hypothetical protein CLIB1444_04S01134 [[Candida] jaroonii]|uniref:Uncharacterized protein n=1 Tax=[Candida] jaroonii TaxID=467808 RepID=A0ACA9Y6F1_9ASCO|nr:hypothetical protein CLIB1444_04S01134 [[Candida] jaroonii]